MSQKHSLLIAFSALYATHRENTSERNAANIHCYSHCSHRSYSSYYYSRFYYSRLPQNVNRPQATNRIKFTELHLLFLRNLCFLLSNRWCFLVFRRIFWYNPSMLSILVWYCTRTAGRMRTGKQIRRVWRLLCDEHELLSWRHSLSFWKNAPWIK